MFTPISTRSRWSMIFAEVKDYKVDDILTYEKITEICEVDDVDSVRTDVYRAIKELEIECKRTMENVRGVGYRVVRANEHERLVRKDIRSIKRKSRRAHSRTVNVRRNELSAEERRKIDEMQLKLAQHGEMLTRMERRVAHNEAMIKAARRETKETMAQLYERLSNVERKLDGETE